MRILMIGGTRFIGPAVARRLDGAGHDVTVFHRGRTEAELPDGIVHIHGDRHNFAASASEFRQLMPDVVLDMAPFEESDASKVLGAFRGIAGRLIAVSSQDVYRAYGRFHRSEPGPPEPVPLSEDAPLRTTLYPYRGSGRGLDFYDKIPVERLLMDSPYPPATVLRLPMVYGEHDYQQRLSLELKRMDDGRPAILVEESFARWRWTRGYVENVAAGIALAVTDPRAEGRVYNLGDAETLSYADWVRTIGRAAGWTGEVIVVPDGRLPPKLRPPEGDYSQHLISDTGRIRRELGFVEPVPFFQGLLRTIDWERANRTDGTELNYEAEDALLAELKDPSPSADPAPLF